MGALLRTWHLLSISKGSHATKNDSEVMEFEQFAQLPLLVDLPDMAPVESRAPTAREVSLLRKLGSPRYFSACFRVSLLIMIFCRFKTRFAGTLVVLQDSIVLLYCL